MAPNKTLVYKKIPDGLPVVGEHLAVEERDVDLDSVPKGGLVLEIQSASLDPYLRGKMRDPSVKSYSPPFHAGDAITNRSIAKVLKSDNDEYKPGEMVLAFVPIAEYARVEDPAQAMIRKIVNPHGLDLGLFLGPLGMPGLTAWSGLFKIGKPKKGETIFVSSAAGAVGQVAGQIAKREGLTVIGSAGSDEKVEFITKELGFDSGFNYKKETPADALKRLAPNGIDIYFDNVGGTHLEAALDNMNTGGRVPVCGMIEIYNTPKEKQIGVRNLMTLIRSNITMEGYLVGNPNFGAVYYKDHQEKMQQWFAEGSIQSKLHVTEGIDNAAEAFLELFSGKSFGKALLKVK